MSVPLHFVDAEVAPGVKLEGGMVQYLQQEVEIRCLPADLPEFIEVDLSQLHIGDSINLSALVLPEGVEIVALQHSPENDRAIVGVVAKRKSSAAEKSVEEGAEAEETAQAKETPAEGTTTEES